MQIKIMMISILVACSYLIGEYIYKAYTKRHKQLNELIRILEIMRMDLAFGLYTLDEIFFRIGKNKETSFNIVFTSICKDLRSDNGKTLEEILKRNFKNLSKNTYLQEKEIEELEKLILALGKGDIASQKRIIDLSISNLKKMTEESLDDINKKGTVYKKLSTIIGLVIGIFLI